MSGMLQEGEPSSAGRTDSSDLAQSVGEMANMADSEEGTIVLARKVFARMFEISGHRWAAHHVTPPLWSCCCSLPPSSLLHNRTPGHCRAGANIHYSTFIGQAWVVWLAALLTLAC